MNHKNKTIKNVPQELWDKLRKRAIDEHTGVSALIIRILKGFVNLKEGER